MINIRHLAGRQKPTQQKPAWSYVITGPEPQLNKLFERLTTNEPEAIVDHRDGTIRFSRAHYEGLEMMVQHDVEACNDGKQTLTVTIAQP